MAGPSHNEGRVAAEGANPGDSSRIRKRQCTQCYRWFWAWDTGRTRCYVCDPLPGPEVRAALDRIQRGAV